MGTAVFGAPRARVGRIKGPTGKFERFLAFYGGECALDGLEAAKKAGYANPSRAFSTLKKTRREALQEVELEVRAAAKVDWEETQEIIAEVARAKAHKDRLKAAELLARIHGKLDTKLNISFDRKTIEAHLQELLSDMARNRLAEAQPLEPAPGAKLVGSGKTEKSK